MPTDGPVDDARGGQVLDREKARGLYDQYWRSLVRYLVSGLGATSDAAEDAVSDVLADIMAQADGGTPVVVKVDTLQFLRTAVRNKYLDHAKRPREESVAESSDLDRTIDAGSRQGASIVIAQEMLAKVRARWDALPEKERCLLVMVDQEGLEIQEAAERLGLNLDSAYTTYSRAHRALEEELGRNWSTYILPATGDTYKPRTREGLLKKVEDLPPEYREILGLSLAEGLGADLLARRLHLSPEVSQERLAKGLEYLRKITGMSMEEIQAVLRKKLGR